MDEDDKPKTEGELTPDEQMIEDETGTSGEEAHRIGEFDDLRGRLERIEGMLGTITESLLKMMRGRFKTVATTCLSCLFVNVAAGDQYLAIILPAKMYGEAFGKQNLEKKLLSRTVEDSGTVTSVLTPWNSCGMTQSTVLGVSTLVYAPFAIFCWLSPITTMLFAAFHSTRKSVSGTPLVNNR